MKISGDLLLSVWLILFTVTCITFKAANGVMYCAHPPAVTHAQCYDGGEDGDDEDDIEVETVAVSRTSGNSRSSMAKTYRVGSHVHYRCSRDFEMVGDSVITCLSSGKWSTSPTCQEISDALCEEAPTIDFGVCTSREEEITSNEVTDEPEPTDETTEEPPDDEEPEEEEEEEEEEEKEEDEEEEYDDDETEQLIRDHNKKSTPSRIQQKHHGLVVEQNNATSTELMMLAPITGKAKTTTKKSKAATTKKAGRKITLSTNTKSTTKRKRATTTTVTGTTTKNSRSKTLATTASKKKTTTTTARQRGIKTKTTTKARKTTTTRRPTRVSSLRSIKTAKCTCQNNYRLSGSAVVRCVGQERWSSLPTCKPSSVFPSQNEILRCDELPPIPGATCRRKVFSLIFGAVASNSEWFDMDPSTQAETRRLAAEQQSLIITNPSITTTVQGLGVISSRDYFKPRSLAGGSEKGTVYDCQCKPGYTQQTDTSFIVCMANGEWSDLPRCRVAPTTRITRYCGVPREVDNAYCYEMAGDATVHDVEALVVRQAPLQSLQGLTVMAGQRVVFRCKPGYEMHGNPIVSCSSQGTWSSYPVCVPNSCTELPEIQYGACEKVMTGRSEIFRPGEEAKCSCDPGFRMIGLPIITCQGQNEWSDVPECYRVRPTARPQATCPSPPPEVDGAGCDCPDDEVFDASEIFRAGDTVRYSCRNGYRMQGDPVITCDENGDWSEPPSCISTSTSTRRTCPQPRKVTHAYCDCEDDEEDVPTRFRVGDQVRYTCNRGYRAVGSTLITCRSSGTWSTYPICEPV